MASQSFSVCVRVFSREVRFRKRAQSADDEGSAELAESLQHLTLSEFLKEYVYGTDLCWPLPDCPTAEDTNQKQNW